MNPQETPMISYRGWGVRTGPGRGSVIRVSASSVTSPARPSRPILYEEQFRESILRFTVYLLLALSFNLVGDALRDALDPTQRGRT